MLHNISAEPLAQMLRSITLHKRTGMLQVEQLGVGRAEQGKMYFESGTLVQVYTQHERGKAALQRICEWKQITYSFQGISRPYPVTAPIETPSQQPRTEDTQAQTLSQTDRLASMPESLGGGQSGRLTSPPFLSRERSTRPLDPRQAENVPFVNARPSISPVSFEQAEQPLILHGTRLEPYAPAQPSGPTRSVKRWTTHLLPVIEAVAVQRPALPVPSRAPLPVPKVLPGSQAIFQVCSTVSTAQVIRQMERRARLVFILLDGQRTIQDIARLTHQTEYDVEQTLVNLAQRGYAQYISG